MLTDALASSHFAIAGKLTGYDAIVVRGARPAPSVLLIDENGPRFRDAEGLAGLTAAQTGATVRERLGPGWRAAPRRPGRARRLRHRPLAPHPPQGRPGRAVPV